MKRGDSRASRNCHPADMLVSLHVPRLPLQKGTRMKELPTPTFPFSQLGLRPAFWPGSGATQRPPAIPVPKALQVPAAPEPSAGGISVSWARHQDDVRAAQRLRFEVFAGEMGARLATPI